MIATLFPLSGGFGGSSEQATNVPLPTRLNGLEVLFNGQAAPLFYARPGQINFQVPANAPQSGTADIEVLEVSDQRVLGSWLVTMNSASPGLFTTTGERHGGRDGRQSGLYGQQRQ